MLVSKILTKLLKKLKIYKRKDNLQRLSFNAKREETEEAVLYIHNMRIVSITDSGHRLLKYSHVLYRYLFVVLNHSYSTFYTVKYFQLCVSHVVHSSTRWTYVYRILCPQTRIFGNLSFC